VEFAFDKARLPEFIADIKALIARDLRGIPGFYAHTRCIPPGYFVLRFGRAPDSLLAHGAGVQQPVYVQVCAGSRARAQRGLQATAS
jgi:hypothetical protein